MSKKNPRQRCPKCGATYRYDVDFQEHEKVGCIVESGKTESLAPDPETSETPEAPQE